MAEKKKEVEVKEVKVEDFNEFFKGVTGLVKENYLSSINVALSLWEENQKLVNAQVEQFFTVQKEYTEQIKSAFEKYSKEVPGVHLNGNLDRITSAQREYINLVKNVSDKVTKDWLSLTQKATEKAFSAFEEHLNLFK
jgi:membrane-associated HD superfamily phosphohydrolase